MKLFAVQMLSPIYNGATWCLIFT